MASPDLLEAKGKLDKSVTEKEQKAKAEAETKRIDEWMKKPRIKIKQLLSTPLTADSGNSNRALMADGTLTADREGSDGASTSDGESCSDSDD
jgi:hypothetical protein